ncbi:MAG: M23 family metallopeptidase [Chloroflexota bacterium]
MLSAREVLAPGDGIVTDVIEGVRDNLPGSKNPYSVLGNAVFIRHKEHEVSVLAHFKQGTIGVKVGDKVVKGQAIGLCGNSGNSGEPHIHYHLQNTDVIQDGTGIKVFFGEVVLQRASEETLKEEYSPVTGDTVAAQSPSEG